MAAFVDLTPEQQVILQHYVDQLVRPAMGELGRFGVRLEAVNDDYVAQSSAILALLDPGEEIPNGSGLAGAAILNEADVVTLTSYVQGVLAFNTATHRQNMAKAAGAENTIG